MAAQNIPPDILLHILKHIVQPTDLVQCALMCKSWSFHALKLLWYKPNLVHTKAWIQFCNILGRSGSSVIPYTLFVRRVNLSALGTDITDAQLGLLGQCGSLERVTLSGCTQLTDKGLHKLLSGVAGISLVSMDLSDVTNVTDATILLMADRCTKLQGLNLSMCKDTRERFRGVTDVSIVRLAEHCPDLRRIKLNNCFALTDASAIALAQHCHSLLEIDLMNCDIHDRALTAIFEHCRELREFRLNQCIWISDESFTQSAFNRDPAYFDQLRVLDLTAVSHLTDNAIQAIVRGAPKIRSLMLNKCSHITDEGVLAICELGRYLHTLQLGHLIQITDASVVELAKHCMRLRYLDLACCWRLTDRAVIELATLSKLKRIGLVKCTNITDHAIHALCQPRMTGTLERVHLSYCANLTVPAVRQLVTSCKRLNHLSLTHVPSFLRTDFRRFCRPPPKDFSPQQQHVFCVFSGKGVQNLRAYLTAIPPDRDPFPQTPNRNTALENLPDGS